MRGKVHTRGVALRLTGITPAYAGKSISQRQQRLSFRDHPRLCGEKSNFNVSHQCTVGSPPPMRGKADVVQQAVSCIGITPAYAGKRSGCFGFWSMIKDHPRLCGEKGCP